MTLRDLPTAELQRMSDLYAQRLRVAEGTAAVRMRIWKRAVDLVLQERERSDP